VVGGLGGDRLLWGSVGHSESRLIRRLAILLTCVSLCLVSTASGRCKYR
jgi:hypothetical protein